MCLHSGGRFVYDEAGNANQEARARGRFQRAMNIATLFLSLVVVIIAWQQWQVARNKLRLDLFDRRYKVYEATRKFLTRMLGEARFDQSDWFEFYAGTADAE